MKNHIITLLILTFICNQIYAEKQFTSEQIKMFTNIEDLKEFSESGFGGGKLINLKNNLYDIYILPTYITLRVFTQVPHMYTKK